MQPYRAEYRFTDWREPEPREVHVVPVIVVGMFLPFPESDGTQRSLQLLAVAQADGHHVQDYAEQFHCTEPTYLGLPEAPEADHEHQWSTPMQPVLEAGRLIGMVTTCTVEGCGAQQTRPAGSALKRAATRG